MFGRADFLATSHTFQRYVRESASDLLSLSPPVLLDTTNISTCFCVDVVSSRVPAPVLHVSRPKLQPPSSILCPYP